MNTVASVLHGLSHTMAEVAVALIPMTALILLLNALFLRLGRAQMLRLARGMALAFVGLTLFLQGVYAGFLPTAGVIGESLALSRTPWVLVPVGFLLGLVATLAEPAVRILNHEVERASGGYIGQRRMLIAISVGVAVSVGLAMLRVLLGFPLLYILVPGYGLALLMAQFVRAEFAGIAFDSGGVATGPMTVTFILAMAVSAATALPGRDPLREGFGLVALVALAPIISVLALGMVYAVSERRMARDRAGGDQE